MSHGKVFWKVAAARALRHGAAFIRKAVLFVVVLNLRFGVDTFFD